MRGSPAGVLSSTLPNREDTLKCFDTPTIVRPTPGGPREVESQPLSGTLYGTQGEGGGEPSYICILSASHISSGSW